jgi:hypothetical protein
MNVLNISLGKHQASFESPLNSINDIRSSLNKPLEVEAFGPQIFLSIIGSKQDVSISLQNEDAEIIDSDNYRLGAK